jgi:hypothetical protein
MSKVALFLSIRLRLCVVARWAPKVGQSRPTGAPGVTNRPWGKVEDRVVRGTRSIFVPVSAGEGTFESTGRTREGGLEGRWEL